MYRKLNIPTLGLLENMSHFECPHCGEATDLFGKGGGEALANELKVPFLGHIPLYAPVRRGGDSGVPIVLGEPDAAASRALISASERVAQQVSIASFSRRAIPLTPVG
jgi:ATP-binding protein involved in chromosome partitioning